MNLQCYAFFVLSFSVTIINRCSTLDPTINVAKNKSRDAGTKIDAATSADTNTMLAAILITIIAIRLINDCPRDQDDDHFRSKFIHAIIVRRFATTISVAGVGN